MMSSFIQRLEKGSIGETLVKQWLEDSGYMVYTPETTGRHWVDIMAHDSLKQTWFACEVKNKKKMKRYHATGFNVTSLLEYQNLEETNNINVLLFFVDSHLKQIYYAPLKSLMLPSNYGGIDYPNYEIANNMVLFPLEVMRPIKHLTDDEVLDIIISN